MSQLKLPVAAILAGGLATRLRPITETIPKALIEVAGQPFIIHQLALLRRKGVTRVVICTGYLGEQITEVVGHGQSVGLQIDYSFDGPTLLGTGGALKKATHWLDEEFLIFYGDSYLDCDYRSVYQAFKDSGKLGLMTVFRNQNQWDTSNVIFSAGHILAYDKVNRTPAMQHLDYGLGILRRETLDQIPANQPHDLANLYQTLLRQGQLAGFEVTQRFYEVGSPQGLAETHAYLTQLTNPNLD